ncbi:cell division cycle and apoptosis regulator protein 1-like [Tropilaelaps mercedesae]|uniref:Cell division cycle and apoptosis regulator protein 1-like n=1 Tax=Tropilaelaps mercedesae TaxID=418985 RepID=A0A1V9XM36_9ACAR|nr:cell division cycle and apoptosis regulator protein 1-like [Tropilaelaps mercedesae]
MSGYRGNPGGSWVRGGGQEYPPYAAGGGGYPAHQGHQQGYGAQGQYGGHHDQGNYGMGGSYAAHQQTGGAPQSNHRCFTGKISKLMDHFGFVDGDVFFQLNCVKGKFPREGDTVYCEASFNPKMPFKWTATSVQLQPNDDHRNGSDKRSPPRGRRVSPRRRERSPPNKRRISKALLSNVDLELASASATELKRRYSNLYIPSDFFHANILWHSAFPPLNPLDLSLSHCAYAVCPRERRLPGARPPAKEPSDTSYKYVAKVVLLATPALNDVYEQCCGPSERTGAEKQLKHPLEVVQLLVGVKAGKFEAIGGPWSPSQDGEDPEHPQTLINTAIRSTQFLTGIDLRGCTSWPRITEVRYRREVNGEVSVEKVVMFFPDVWRCVPTHREWTKLSEELRSEVPVEEEPPAAEEPAAAAAAAPGEKKEDEPSEPTAVHNDESQESSGEVLLPGGSDPRQMKVADLRVELEKRGLDTKGVKQALAERLVEFLQQERHKEHGGGGGETGETKEEMGEPKAAQEGMEVDSQENTEDKPEGKDGSTAGKDEEKDRAKDKAAKDEEKKEQTLPIFELPTNPAIVVVPNRKAKGGKFDCRLVNLSRLLEYSESDNKEILFELNLFCELLKSMFYRDHAFNLYKGLLEAPDLNKEQENRLAAKKKREEQKKEDKKDEDKKAAAPEADEIEIEIKDEVDEDYEKIYDEKTVRNPALLLSCVFFDLARVGHFNSKEVEDIALALNLCLSRAQVRNVLKKVITKEGNIEYKKLTHRHMDPDEPPEGFEYPTPLSAVQLRDIVKGNNGEVADESTSPSNVVTGAAFVDVDKLREQVEKSERAKVEVDAALLKVQDELEKTTHQLDRVKKDRDRLEADLGKANKMVDNLNEELRQARRFSSDIRYTAHNTKNTLKKALENLERCLERDKKRASGAGNDKATADNGGGADAKGDDAASKEGEDSSAVDRSDDLTQPKLEDEDGPAGDAKPAEVKDEAAGEQKPQPATAESIKAEPAVVKEEDTDVATEDSASADGGPAPKKAKLAAAKSPIRPNGKAGAKKK